jgi:hypothetical protein
MQMNPKSNLSRSAEMQACEKAILELFTEKQITVSEALFIFEKIKFSALYGTMATQVKQEAPSSMKDLGRMFG